MYSFEKKIVIGKSTQRKYKSMKKVGWLIRSLKTVNRSKDWKQFIIYQKRWLQKDYLYLTYRRILHQLYQGKRDIFHSYTHDVQNIPKMFQAVCLVLQLWK